MPKTKTPTRSDSPAAALARRRLETQTPERRKEIASAGGRAWWDSLTDEERAARTAKLVASRGHKRKASKSTGPRKKTLLP